MATNKELEKQISDLTQLVSALVSKKTSNGPVSSRTSNKRHSAVLVRFVNNDPVPVDFSEAKSDPDGVYVSYGWKKGDFHANKDRTRRIPLALYLEGMENALSIFDSLK